ncbi:MAG: hypothetical protein HFJ45_07620 [Clostridia bacterium]|nr:hypothetical protein [Clostridia bacterium]
MKYCKNYSNIGGRFYDGTIITSITIPPGCGEQAVSYVLLKVLTLGGKIWENPAIGSDGSFLITPITFNSDESRTECCKDIEAYIESQMPISINTVEGKENQYNLKLNLKYLFVQFQDIMKKIKPAIDFIENNGGWFDPETKQFSGYDALKKAYPNGLSEIADTDLHAALIAFCNFMGAYTIGSTYMNDENTTTTIN